ncbi:MAG: hypothetical protein GKR86_00145 [Ilumatobacter sp.]|nr:hypothetical protein [Ilumatobacter sp.]
MAYTDQQLMTALRNADSAGDTDGARRIAQMIKAQRSSAPAQPEPQPEPEEEVGFFEGIGNSISDFGSSVADMVTGESQMTPEIEGLSEIGSAPELNELNMSAFSTSLGLLATGDQKKAQELIKSNLPDAKFKQDSKGNVIVDLPSGQYALNSPGLSGQDIVRGAFDLAAFTPAGRAGSLAKVAAGSAATEAGLQGITSAVGGGEIDGGDIVEAGILGGVGKVAENAIGAGYRTLKGKAQGDVEDVAKFAQEQDLPLMTSDVVQPKTFVGKSVQSAAEKVPIVGTGGMREQQQAARSDLVKQFSQRFGEYNPEEVVSSLERQTARAKKAAGTQRQQVVDKMQGAEVTPKSATQAIDDEIQRLSKTPSGEMRATADVQTIDKLEAYKADLMADKSFDNLEQLRTQFRTDVKGERIVMPNRSEAAMSRIYNAMGKDIDDSIGSTLGEGAQSQWKRANKAYADEAMKIKNTRLKSVLQKGDLTPEVVNNLIYSNKPSEFKTLYKSLDAKGKRATQSALISKALEKSGDSPDRFLNQLTKMKSQLGVAFKGEDKKYIDGMMKYLDTTRQAGKAGVMTPTGQQLFQLGAPLGALATGMQGVVAAVGFGGLARAYESKPFREAMTRLNAMEKGSSVFEKQMEKVTSYLLAMAQSQRREEF